MNKIIRIGTRDSQLALWQAETVKNKLEKLGYKTVLVPVKSTGDIVLDKPLYELGITGIFTKTLDIAMLNGDVDIAVHSMKDVPTLLPIGIIQSAVLERANTSDILVHKGLDFLNKNGTIATGSLRRKAQWLHKYPKHQVVDLRGNVNLRLQKLSDNNWDAAIFAKAGLERIDVLPENYIDLSWMVPAPAQGAVVVHTMADDKYTTEAVCRLNDKKTDLCTAIERSFLRELEGGCTAPIGALATIEDNKISFDGVLFSLDGSQKVIVKYRDVALSEAKTLGERCAKEVISNGGDKLMTAIKTALN